MMVATAQVMAVTLPVMVDLFPVTTIMVLAMEAIAPAMVVTQPVMAVTTLATEALFPV